MDQFIYAREIWHGESRDGVLEDGTGYHYFKMKNSKLIVEAFEYYEADDGQEVSSPLPEMRNIDWIDDLGFEDLETLEIITEDHYNDIKELVEKKK